MTNKYRYLMRMQFYHLFGINRLLHSHDAKEKQRSAIVAVLALAAVAILVVYTAKFSYIMAQAGLAGALPAMMVVICSLASLMLTFVKSTGVLIGEKDYDMVMSLPIHSLSVVLSRTTMLYFTNLILGLTTMLPSCILYGMYVHPAASGYLFLAGGLLFSPVIPMILALTLGILITAISSRSRHTNFLSLLLSTLGVLLIVFASAKSQAMDTVQITDLGAAVTDAVNQFYPPAALFSNALLHHDWGSFFLFAGSSLVLFILFTAVVSYFYKTLNTAAFSHHAGKDYQIRGLKQTPPLIALYKKELNRLVSCTIYALNSCIGIILLLVISIMTVFFLPASLKMQLEAAGMMKLLQNVLPMGLAVFVSMTSTTAPSLSLEGKNRWIMCSVPVRARVIYQAKIAVNLTVILPVLLISAVLLRIVFPLSMVQTLFMFITPVIYAFFISVLGIFLNIKFPKYDWTSEYYAVKGGAVSVLATVGAGMAASLLPLYLCITFAKYSLLITTAMTAVVLVITTILYQKICGIKLYAL